MLPGWHAEVRTIHRGTGRGCRVCHLSGQRSVVQNDELGCLFARGCRISLTKRRSLPPFGVTLPHSRVTSRLGGGSPETLGNSMNADSAKSSPSAGSRMRQCYCGSSDDASLRQRNIPPGFCGICERCGAPGHTRHFPGPIPYTGAWCDRCVRIVALTWPLKSPRLWFAVLVALIVWFTTFRR